MRVRSVGFLVLFLLAGVGNRTHAQGLSGGVCDRPAIGGAVGEPVDLRSANGVLEVELTLRNDTDAQGRSRYCYITPDGSQSPNIRLKPGDLLILHLKNRLVEPQSPYAAHHQANATTKSSQEPCSSGVMTVVSTNLHFHGLTIPPVCHQDEVMKTAIQPSDAAFEYRIQIPRTQPPGLYWYHPHIHGFSAAQVSGGASGALIIEGIERTNRELAGLRERVFVVRDEILLNPNAPLAKSEGYAPVVRFDRDGDVQNTGTGTGKPARDLSLNFVSVPYPDYPAAVIKMRPKERQLWRVLNASALTYLNLQVLFNGTAQMLEMVALDGVPVNAKGSAPGLLAMRNHLGVPPGGRVEFIMPSPPDGVTARLVNRTVNTGPGGENDPNRPLAAIDVVENAPEPVSMLASLPVPLPAPALPWLGDVAPARTRKLYFSETLEDPKDPNSPTTFFITLEGEKPTPFDPNSDVPNIVVKQGDVEDWVIENRSNELHAFHIHQIHFLLLDWNGIPVNEPFLRDTINVPFHDGKSPVYPNVTLRMDFRDPGIAGTFPYHCHLLDHEDSGMMGMIRVEPAAAGLQGINAKAKDK